MANTEGALPTPQSSTISHVETGYDIYLEAKARAVTALNSVLENSPTNDEELAREGAHINALVSLSASLVSMLIKFGNEEMCEQVLTDVTRFIVEAMDASHDMPQSEELAGFVFNYIDHGHHDPIDPTPNSPIVGDTAPLITPEEEAEDNTEPEEVSMEVVPESPVQQVQVSRREHKSPLNYDPTPIAEVGAEFMVKVFGTYTCPTTVPGYTPTLSEYIADTIKSARFERSVAIYALALCTRLGTLPSISAPHGTFGLFITAFMIAGKVLPDWTYTSNAWRRIGQKMFTLEEMNEMERLMCKDLDWKLIIRSESLRYIQRILYKRFYSTVRSAESRVPTPISDPVSPPSSSPLEEPSRFEFDPECFVPLPQTPTSSESPNSSEVDRSPKWAPPSPSAIGSNQVGSQTGQGQKLVWVEHHAAEFESEECTDSEDDEESDEEFF